MGKGFLTIITSIKFLSCVGRLMSTEPLMCGSVDVY